MKHIKTQKNTVAKSLKSLAEIQACQGRSLINNPCFHLRLLKVHPLGKKTKKGKRRKKETFSNSFYEVNTTLKSKPNKDITKNK